MQARIELNPKQKADFITMSIKNKQKITILKAVIEMKPCDVNHGIKVKIQMTKKPKN